MKNFIQVLFLFLKLFDLPFVLGPFDGDLLEMRGATDFHFLVLRELCMELLYMLEEGRELAGHLHEFGLNLFHKVHHMDVIIGQGR